MLESEKLQEWKHQPDDWCVLLDGSPCKSFNATKDRCVHYRSAQTRWMDGLVDGLVVNGWMMDGRTTDGRTDGRTTDGRTTDGRMDGRMDGWMDGWMDETL